LVDSYCELAPDWRSVADLTHDWLIQTVSWHLIGCL